MVRTETNYAKKIEIAREQDLMKRAVKDPEAFGVIYEKNIPSVFAHCLAITKDPDKAADLAQQTMMLGFIHRRSYKPDAPVNAWLNKIAANLGSNLHRDELRHAKILTSNATGVPGPRNIDPHETAEKQAEIKALGAAFPNLPKNQQKAVLHTTEGLTAKQVGSIMNISEGAVKQLLLRGRRKLRDKIENAF